MGPSLYPTPRRVEIGTFGLLLECTTAALLLGGLVGLISILK